MTPICDQCQCWLSMSWKPAVALAGLSCMPLLADMKWPKHAGHTQRRGWGLCFSAGEKEAEGLQSGDVGLGVPGLASPVCRLGRDGLEQDGHHFVHGVVPEDMA